MNQRKFVLIAALSLLMLLLAACGTKQTSEPVNETRVIAPTSTPSDVHTGEVTAAPTSDPLPSPTPTIAPSATPQATATPAPSPTPTMALTAGDYFEQGILSFEQDNFETAIAAFDQAIALDPWSQTETFFYHQLSRQGLEAHLALSEFDAQIAALDRTISENPENAEAYYERGRAKYSRTLQSGESLERRPLFGDSDGVNVIGGTITADTLNLEQVIADFDEAIALDPDFAAAYHQRGLAYHLQSLEYIGIALVDFTAEDIEQAIRDYDRAIALNPELTMAYQDRGAAVTLRSWLVDEDSEAELEPAEEYNQAIRDFTVAIDGAPESTDLYINRAFAHFLLVVSVDDTGETVRDIILTMFDDASQAIALDPDQPWGYLLRALAFGLAEELPESQDLASQWESIAMEDSETFDELVADLVLQYELADVISRVLTLSQGPPVIPMSSVPQSFGQFTSDRYSGPDGNLEMVIPALLQPNAVIWDELTASGDLLIWLEDDLDRWYSIQVHPGTLDNSPLSEWVDENINQDRSVEEVYEIDSQNGPVVVTEYRHLDPEGSCASAVLHLNDLFYSVEYCLPDQLEAEDEGFGSFRLFAAGYGIEYEPVDMLLLEFLQGVEILGQPVLTPESAVIGG